MSKQQLQCVLISTMTVDIIPGAVADIEKAKQVFTGEADELAGEMMDKVLERVASFATVHSVSTATRTRQAGASVLANCLTEELRDRGYAVVIFGPNELGNQDAESLENELVQTGNERIDMTAREVGGCEDQPLKYWEIIAVGFDGGTDETDDRIIWVRADNEQQVKDAIEGTGATFGVIDAEIHDDGGIDFVLPSDVEGLRKVLLDFKADGQPNEDQMAAIQRFKEMHGATWKEDLMDCWLKAAYPRNYSDTHWLQQVRNQFGPQWLEKQ